MVSVYAIAQLVFLLPSVNATKPWAVLLAAALMVGATAGAFALRGPDVPVRAAMVIPVIDLLAVGFLRSGTGGLDLRLQFTVDPAGVVPWR